MEVRKSGSEEVAKSAVKPHFLTSLLPYFLTFTGVLFVSGCSSPTPEAPAQSPSAAAPHLVEQAHLTMGSELRITVWTSDDGTANGAMEAVFAEFDRLDGLL